MTYEDIGKAVGQLVEAKQMQYGDSFSKSGKILAVLYPSGIAPAALPEALTIVRVIDKLLRIATAQGKPDAGGESPWQDIAGYALLELGKRVGETK